MCVPVIALFRPPLMRVFPHTFKPAGLTFFNLEICEFACCVPDDSLLRYLEMQKLLFFACLISGFSRSWSTLWYKGWSIGVFPPAGTRVLVCFGSPKHESWLWFFHPQPLASAVMLILVTNMNMCTSKCALQVHFTHYAVIDQHKKQD